jgi:hypothetical protein
MKKTVRKRKIVRKRKEFNYKLLVLIETPILLLFLALGIFSFVKSNPAIMNMITLATTVKAETFTELYFEDHTNLPKDTNLYEEKTFKFTVHNLEYKTMTYPYEVYIDFEGEKQMIDEGSISLKQNQYKTIEESYLLTYPTQRVKIIVNLINKNQQIDFWIGEAL